MLEEDNALATETAGKEDQDCARLEGGSDLGRLDGFASLFQAVLAKSQKIWLSLSPFE